jgi:hypothetical protein
MSGEAFKKYAYSLIYFLGCGFLFSLITFLAKAVLIMFGTNEGIIDPLIGAAGGNAVASWILQVFYPVSCIFILSQVDKVTQLSAGIATRITGAKEGFLVSVEKSSASSSSK